MISLKALITGASGFVGTEMTKTLLKNNIEVMGISRTTSALNGQVTEKYVCDIQEKSKLKKILGFYRPNYIIHLAGPAFIPHSFDKPEITYDVIFKGTLNLLESMRELKLASRLLYVSSADVYGSGLKSVLSERDALEPANPYSTAKACSELLSKQFFYSYGTDVIIARPFNHTGPGQSADFVCSSFAQQVATMRDGLMKKQLVTGNIDVKRDFLDVRDVVEAYMALLNNGVSGQLYNVCSGQAVSIREIVKMLFRFADIEEYEIKVDSAKVRENDVALRVGDNKKIVTNVGWLPNYKIEQTIGDLLEYWRENLRVKA
ncbi:GDP-mannose 4,6-dehydratase [Cohnella abietis]|uniref:dTDP-glucose 4,6-dehydratase n=1 Tax=Cohnella abietis TaxID=2507935 RepID=A0A3T1DDL3_9BACL|nr:GDP-mannose 4,6-dehydratase [Cohnella abietis]BBI36182.1 dTDP-glucose 4,6-dehydratase [Cohnella abietis]